MILHLQVIFTALILLYPCPTFYKIVVSLFRVASYRVRVHALQTYINKGTLFFPISFPNDTLVRSTWFHAVILLIS